ncbi:hypothetical protein SADUNF_Sadunf14G0104100 [Salix dunnii]|uniref:Uncharacterized protein n=1 Tax=Salix dunnii TaxID=1413687 RepID=A0A835JFR3_9ROSI|nr:hypothetical protein SADUNF_Sadunf14G0104100 [Salix dunnii]
MPLALSSSLRLDGRKRVSVVPDTNTGLNTNEHEGSQESGSLYISSNSHEKYPVDDAYQIWNADEQAAMQALAKYHNISPTIQSLHLLGLKNKLLPSGEVFMWPCLYLIHTAMAGELPQDNFRLISLQYRYLYQKQNLLHVFRLERTVQEGVLFGHGVEDVSPVF